MSYSDHPQSGVLSPLNADSRCCILSDPNGTIIIVHDKDIKSELQWIEYDKQENRLYLIHEEGQVQDLGIQPNDAMKNNIAHGIEVTLVKLENKKLQNEHKVVLLIKDYEA